MSKICELCQNINVSDNWTVQIKDDKDTFKVSGHKSCIDAFFEKGKNVKELNKKSVKKILKEIGFVE